MNIRRLTYIAVTVTLTVVCSWISIPFAVPFTLQTFAVFCTLLVLGGKDGLLSILLYILLGAVGLPVFSGFRGGIAHLMGPTGGYIWGFAATAAIYWLFERNVKGALPMRRAIFALALGLIACYAFGTAWFAAVYRARGTAYGVGSVLLLCVVPYIVPDLCKLFLAMQVGKRITRILHREKDAQ
ncbi:MAG: biotin transporter BioY [Christensenellales bacterium]